MDAMHSFTPILEKWLKTLNPTRVWEWGPGRSTGVILNSLREDGHLTSIEHHPIWLAKIRAEIGIDARWTSNLVSATRRVSSYAHCILQTREKQDIIFIDGRRRVECAIAALQAISPEGVIILHDSCRKAYIDILNPFIELHENQRNTLVFRPHSDLRF